MPDHLIFENNFKVIYKYSIKIKWSGGSGGRLSRVFADTPCAAYYYFSDFVTNDKYDRHPD